MTGTRTRAHVGLAAAAAAAVLAIAVQPGPLLRVFPRYGTVVDHLPGRGLDAGDPIYFHASSERPAQVNTSAIRRAGMLLPDEAVFYVRRPSGDETADDIVLAARLFFLPAVESRRREAADWILTYRARGSEPVGRVYELDPDLRLTRVR